MTKGSARDQSAATESAPLFGERKGIRPDAKAPEEFLRILDAVLDALPDLVVVLDREGRQLASNAAWRAALGDLPAGDTGNMGDRGDRGNYLGLAARLFGEKAEEKAAFEAGVRAFLEGASADPATAATSIAANGWEVSAMLEGRRCWFVVRASPLPAYGEGAFLFLHRPVTELRKAETDLRESHALFQHTVEHLREGVFLYDKEGRYFVVNSVYAEALGFSPAQLIGKTFFEIFKPELAVTLQEQNLLVLTTGQTFDFELMVETPRGPRHFSVSKGVYRNHRSEVAAIFGVTRDVSNHRRVEKTLEKSERHFRALIEKSADRVALLARDGTIRYTSPSTKRILGFELEEMVGTDAFLWAHPQDIPALRRRFRELLELPGISMTGEYRALRSGGEWQWMETTATNLLDDPSVGAIVINERDITERKQTEADLVRFANIVESSNDAIVSADPEGVVISWNPAAERIFGYPEKEILRKSVQLLIPSEWREAFCELRNAALRNKGTNDIETVLLHKNGRKIDASLTLSPIHDRDRQTTGFSLIVRDTTERRRLEKEILEISDREKQRIGQDLHDDLCQHLVGISLVSNVLYEELAALGLPQAKEALHVTQLVRQAVDHARTLARGLSPLNLVDTGLLTNLEMLVASTEQLFRVRCVFECGEPLYVKNGSAAIHLYRIVQEALHNAVKHSCASEVVVSLEARESVVVVVIRDNGVGFSRNTVRVQESKSSSGLGMHTMQYRAKIIGATLEFHSAPEEGTRVVCRVPRRKLSR